MGIQGLTYATRPKGKPYDTCHEITAFGGSKVNQIAAGDYHSLARDDQGRVFSFGDNTNGQLGFDYDPEANSVSVPTLLTFATQYPSNKTTPTVKNIAAGGANSYFAVDVEDTENRAVTSDLLACGTGIHGNLGNGRWTHVQGPPVKVKLLSGLSECHPLQVSTHPNQVKVTNERSGPLQTTRRPKSSFPYDPNTSPSAQRTPPPQ
jgi:alpha-tubulin suppressor-like RCC1 family protein